MDTVRYYLTDLYMIYLMTFSVVQCVVLDGVVISKQ